MASTSDLPRFATNDGNDALSATGAKWRPGVEPSGYLASYQKSVGWGIGSRSRESQAGRGRLRDRPF
jgi:hypothetical protein